MKVYVSTTEFSYEFGASHINHNGIFATLEAAVAALKEDSISMSDLESRTDGLGQKIWTVNKGEDGYTKIVEQELKGYIEPKTFFAEDDHHCYVLKAVSAEAAKQAVKAEIVKPYSSKVAEKFAEKADAMNVYSKDADIVLIKKDAPH